MKIRQDSIQIEVYTRDQRITGKVHVPKGGRVSDLLNAGKEFIPLTEFKAYDIGGREIRFYGKLILLNRASVVGIVPLGEELLESSYSDEV